MNRLRFRHASVALLAAALVSWLSLIAVRTPRSAAPAIVQAAAPAPAPPEASPSPRFARAVTLSSGDASSARSEGEARVAAIRGAVTSTVAALAGELRAGIAAHPAAPTYDACVLAGRDCLSLYSDLLYYVIDTADLPGKAQSNLVGLRDSMAADDAPTREAMHSALAEVIANSADPTDRIAALLLVKYAGPTSQPGPTPLPEAEYRNAAARPAPELRLIADIHREMALPTEEAASEFVALAHASDTRVRRVAIDALGHPATAAKLHEALLHAAIDEADWPHVALAVANCGLSCSKSIEHIMQSGGRGARLAMYQALGMAPESEIGSLVELALASSPAIEAEESAIRASMLENALADDIEERRSR